MKLETFLNNKDEFGISILDEAKRVNNEVFFKVLNKYKVNNIEKLSPSESKNKEIIIEKRL